MTSPTGRNGTPDRVVTRDALADASRQPLLTISVGEHGWWMSAERGPVHFHRDCDDCTNALERLEAFGRRREVDA